MVIPCLNSPFLAWTQFANQALPALPRHWRFISSFHGAWLQLPVEILQIICNITYNAPAPAPIDPAVLFDMLKIRRLVDEATQLAVKAAGETSPFEPSGGGGRLSRERKLRIREHLCQRLSEAYRLDEIACSVAMMQGAATLEDVAGQVLARNPKSMDAKYVHFFHEKIPSRQMAECTSLEPLGEVLAAAAGHATEVLRTRATVKVFQGDLEGAAQDLTEALAQCRHRQLGKHKAVGSLTQGAGVESKPRPAPRKVPDAPVSEELYPDSLPGQLLFHRGSVYLLMACRRVSESFSHTPASSPNAETTPHIKDDATSVAPRTSSTIPNASHPQAEGLEDEALKKRRIDAQLSVKNFAKHALRDFTGFIDRFQYSPDWPTKASEDFTRRIDAVSTGSKGSRAPSLSSSSADADTLSSLAPTNRLYRLSELFAAVPPPNLPPFSPQTTAATEQLHVHANVPGTATAAAAAAAGCQPSSVAQPVCESVTYHPLLTEALHALLLCHCLVQTSPKEIQRHATMVARLVRLCDGFPIFQSCRSPAREDWADMTRRPVAETGLLPLDASWDELCAPKHLKLLSQRGVGVGALAAAADARKAASSAAAASAYVSSGDDARSSSGSGVGGSSSVVRPEMAAVHSSVKMLAQTYSRAGPTQSDIAIGNALMSPGCRLPQRATAEMMRDYPLTTERAAAVAQWLREAPVVAAAPRRRKKPNSAGKKTPLSSSSKNGSRSTATVAEQSGQSLPIR